MAKIERFEDIEALKKARELRMAIDFRLYEISSTIRTAWRKIQKRRRWRMTLNIKH